MGDSPRLEALRRRVLADPASIAFAALAEEYRRAARLPEAIETARAGLERHPAYVTARVTLGRALLEAGEVDDARRELEQALTSAPENLAALRALADLYRSTGVLTRARDLARRGAALAPQDREWRALLEALDTPAVRRLVPPSVIQFSPSGRPRQDAAAAPIKDDDAEAVEAPVPAPDLPPVEPAPAEPLEVTINSGASLGLDAPLEVTINSGENLARDAAAHEFLPASKVQTAEEAPAPPAGFPSGALDPGAGEPVPVEIQAAAMDTVAPQVVVADVLPEVVFADVAADTTPDAEFIGVPLAVPVEAGEPDERPWSISGSDLGWIPSPVLPDVPRLEVVAPGDAATGQPGDPRRAAEEIEALEEWLDAIVRQRIRRDAGLRD